MAAVRSLRVRTRVLVLSALAALAAAVLLLCPGGTALAEGLPAPGEGFLGAVAGDALPLRADGEGDMPTSGPCGEQGDNVTYEFDAETGTLTISGEGAIAEGAFAGRSDVTQVIVNEGVTRIGSDAFAECTAMESIALPNSLTSIGGYAFGACERLSSISIPDSVESIGGSAFCDCVALESISLPSSLTTLGEYMFEACPRLASVDISAGVTTIEEGAFLDCLSLVSVSLPESLTTIGDWAFGTCVSLQDVSIPAGVESIGSEAFGCCPNARFVVAEGNPNYDSRDGCNALIETATNTLLKGSASSTIPDTVEVIGEGAFAEPNDLEQWMEYLGLETIEWPKMTAADIPNAVQAIGERAFYGCIALSEVSIPDGLEEIGAYAFQNCPSLSALAVPASVTSIGSGAFSGTTAAIDFAGSRAQWEAITGGGSGAEPASYGLVGVTFETNGGSEVARQDVAAGGTATEPDPAPTKDWCELDGWYADEALETPFDFAAPVTEDTIVYAKWRTMLVVTFNSCGGSAVETQHVWPGGKATAPEEPTKDGRDFVGWFTDEDYGTAFDFDTAITADTIVYAKWRVAESGEDDPDGGAAYARFDSGTGTFTFFRSWKEYATDQTETYIDEAGLEQTITYYADIETTAYSGNNVAYYAPWWRKISKNVKSVVFACEITPISTATWFYDMSNLESISGIEKLDTSKVTSTYRMFCGCSKLTELDVSHMEVDKVTAFGQMFYGCSGLSVLDVSGWKTSSAVGMYDMFLGCSGLTSIDVSSFDTSNVVNIGGMFSGCRNLASLDLSSFKTPKLESMLNMFAQCWSLTSLDLSSFDTSHVTNMGGLLYDCRSLTEVDLSSFDTSNATGMHSMFYGCESLTKIDLSGFDTSNVTDMGYLFMSCRSLSSIDLTGFNTDKVTQMRYMFSGCSELTSLDLSRFNTDNVTLMQAMFMNCNKLERLDLSHFNTSKANAANQTNSMLGGCSSLKEINLGAETQIAPGANLPVSEWQLADLGDTSVRYEALSEYDGSRPGWYLQGHGDLSIGGVADATYTGEPITQAPTVAVGGRELAEGADYALSYRGNTRAGTATVTVEGRGVWSGSASADFEISPKKAVPSVALSQAEYTYDGTAKAPGVTVRDGAAVLAEGTDYDVALPAGRTGAGTYQVRVTLKGNRSGSGSASFTIAKAANTLKAKGRTVKLKASKLKKKAQKVTPKKAMKVSGAVGKPTYKLASAKRGKRSFKKFFKVSRKTGKITVKKGLRRGTYKVKVKVAAPGDANHLPKSKTVTVKVKVK